MARFERTYCSQCGGVFGPGDEGYSHCSDHQPPALTAVQIKGALIASAMDYGRSVADELPQRMQQSWLDAIKEKMALLENHAYAEGRTDESKEMAGPLMLMRDAFDLLESHLGDSDVHYDDDEEEREYAPVQVAARYLMAAIQSIQGSKA